jgi:hypothetical protein
VIVAGKLALSTEKIQHLRVANNVFRSVLPNSNNTACCLTRIQEIELLDAGLLQICPNGPREGDVVQVGALLAEKEATMEAHESRLSALFEVVVRSPQFRQQRGRVFVSGGAP